MQEERHARRPPLEVERAFACSRLEAQVLSRAYELVVPLIRARVASQRSLEERPGAEGNTTKRTSQGA